MSGHTLGPWSYGEGTTQFNVRSEVGLVAFIKKNKIVDNIRTEADARLIAAAPELLEALLEAVLCLNHGPFELAIAKRAFAAIDKARGKS